MGYTPRMLSLFPQILFLAPLGIMLLRIVAACYLAYIAWHLLNKHAEIERVSVPLIGHVRPWMVWLSAVIISGVAALIFIGAWTQIAAILGIITVIKHLTFFRKFQSVLPFPRSTYVLLLCILITLVVSGAGAFAFDFPL